jgi:hypothetical protein
MELPWKLFGGIIVLWVLVGVVPFVLSRDVHDAAEFASTFEFVNALFAALAFGGVIWAIRLQTKELELQRLEVEETRDELRRSADAQTLSQEMHFLSALLAARNNVAQGYAAAAAQETGTLRPNQAAHRQHLIELEWLLQQVDRHPANPFSLPPVRVLVVHQIGRLLERAHLPLQTALTHRATNHVRSLLLELNQTVRELRRQLPCEGANDLSQLLDRQLILAESVTTIDDFVEISKICCEVFDQLSEQMTAELNRQLPKIGTIPCQET